MKRYYPYGLVGALAGVLLLAGCAAGQATPAAAADQEPTGITVVGEGKAIATPDVAYISLGVETTGSTAKAAMDDNSRRMTEVIQQLKGLGIAERDIQTSGISLQPIYESRRMEQPGILPNIIGYRASNLVTVTINDLARAPEVLDGVVNVGANQVSGLQFGIKDDSRLRQQALAEASKQSKDKAKAIADALGVTIIGIASVQEDFSGGPVPLRDAKAALAAEAAASTPVLSGELTVTARVQVTYRYQ